MNETQKPLRTAAYCRVSTKSDLQDGSFETQCAYYHQLITQNPHMELVRIYGDHGKSGRSMKSRKELSCLIKDCEEGKIDLVLTKSISRFARNMMECVECIRHLKSLHVAVRFEREGLDTRTMDGELLLCLLATIAQEESNSISQNMQWSRCKHVEQGQPWDPARYGYISVGKEHRWEIQEPEASFVRHAFYMAGMCYTYEAIARELTCLEAEKGTGRVWNKTPVVNLLRSSVYIGNYLSNKECTIVDKNGIAKRVRNRGYRDQVLIEEHHPPLISHDLYFVVQKLLDYRILGSHRRNFTEEERCIMKHSMNLAVKEAKIWK